MNMVMEELLNVVTAGGLTPSKTTYTQVRDALKAMFSALNGSSTQPFSVAAATTAAQAVNLGQFTTSQLGNGYQKIPGGLILQWGLNACGLTSAGAAVAFPIAFPNACLQVLASDSGLQDYSYGCASFSKAGFTLTGGGTSGSLYSGGQARWLAIGY
jgi:hypothetical protein